MDIELTSSADNSKYLIHAKTEIAYILRGIMQKNELVTAYFHQGNDFLLTSIIAVEPDEDVLLLDFGANDETNKKMLASSKVIFVTTQEKVKIQFAENSIEATTFNQRDAFKLKLPTELLKLQRREYYRLTTPIAHPLKCVIPWRKGENIEVNIVDISVGGIGVIAYSSTIQFEPGADFEGCRITLPDIGNVVVRLAIKSTFEVTLKNNVKTRRSGCEFVGIAPSVQAMIQRYIIKLERDRRAKLGED